MNEYDSLELELSSLRPRGMSAAAKERIAERLGASPLNDRPPMWSSAWLRGAVVIGAIAASVAVVVLWRGGARPNAPDMSVEEPNPGLAAAFDRSLPSIWSYRQALMHSPEAWDGMLDAHSMRSLQLDQSAPPAVFARFAFQTSPSSGEL
jgi:hypothetical protein